MLKIKIKLSKRGFSLVEIMVAVAILAMAIFGIFLAYSTGFMGMADAKYRTIATNIAQEKMEEIKNISFVDSSTDSDTVSGINFTTTVDVTPIETNLSYVITTVAWFDRKGNQKEVKLEMLVYALQTTASSLEIGSIYISAEPAEVTCCIGETSTITALVYDTSGNLVPDGIIVSFSTTSISASLSSDFAPTFDEGTAIITLTLGDEATTVTAFIGAVSDTVDITCIVPDISVVAVPSDLAACETSIITATITDTDTPIANQVVVFSTDKGTLSDDSAVTNESGEAIVTLISGYEGKAIVVASFCGETRNTTINFTTPIISVNADPAVIALDTTTTSTITATVTDASNNPVKNQIIEFTTDEGTLSNDSAVTNENGEATVTLTLTYQGKATVQASYCSITRQVEVIAKPGPSVYYLIVSASPQEIEADGESTSTITATLYAPNDQPVAAWPINFSTEFSTEYGTLSATSVNTGDNGVATVTLTSSTTPIISTVTASTTTPPPPDGNLISEDTTVTFYSSEPDRIELTANPVLVHGGESEVTAIIKKGSHTITTYVGEVDFSIIEGGEYAYFLGSNPVEVNNGKASRTLTTRLDVEFPSTLTVYAFSTFTNSLNEVVTIEGYIDVPIVKIVIQLTDPPDVSCDTGCTKVSFIIKVLGWGEDYLTVEKMKVTWPSGLVDSSEKLNEIRITGQSGWDPAWTGDVTAGTDVFIYQRLSRVPLYYTLELFFDTDMFGKTIEVIFYTDKGDFLLELEIGAPG